MTIKSRDIVVLAKLLFCQKKSKNWTQARLAEELCLSPSLVYCAIKRLLASRPFSNVIIESELKPVPFIQLGQEFLIHGLKFGFPPEFGTLTRGIPTAFAAPGLNKILASSGNDSIPVWPHIKGTYQGTALTPLYHCVTKSIIKRPNSFL